MLDLLVDLSDQSAGGRPVLVIRSVGQLVHLVVKPFIPRRPLRLEFTLQAFDIPGKLRRPCFKIFLAHHLCWRLFDLSFFGLGR